jgi:hypothetical protein
MIGYFIKIPYYRMKGGSCGTAMCTAPQMGGGKRVTKKVKGGYRATKRDKKYLLLWKKGKSIGFTMRSSLKAKGLIPRANGTRRVSKKYN